MTYITEVFKWVDDDCRLWRQNNAMFCGYKEEYQDNTDRIEFEGFYS